MFEPLPQAISKIAMWKNQVNREEIQEMIEELQES